MRNALTFDVEEYFHVSAYADHVRPEDWRSYPSRVGASVNKILDLLDEHHCRATFFSLGWIAENRPEVIRQIAARGHEIACHSFQHRRVFDMTPEEFREDTRSAKAILEDVSGAPVLGYRAPSFSITGKSQWAVEILAELGFAYDSSVFPVRHLNYGMPKAPRSPFRIETRYGSIVEFPMPTLDLGGVRAPFGGGAYLRLLPYRYTFWAIEYTNERENRPVCVYLHPWEIDADQPRMHGSLTAKARHYFGLSATETKLKRLLGAVEFGPLSSLIEQAIPESAANISTPA
jgi:polysaccharide deacetylase family protein (PEP-CTERM system associated)